MNEYRLKSDGALALSSSGGKLLKWKAGNKFIKTSTLDTTSILPRFMYESYAEVIAYHIAQWIGIRSTKYSLCKLVIDDGIETIACESIDFNKNGEQYISIGKLMMEQVIPVFSIDSYKKVMELIEEAIPGFKHYTEKMIILDYIILNDDRHFGNFGIIRDALGNYRKAPIFDNGNSLFCHKHTENIQYSPSLDRHLICRPFSRSFDVQLGLVKTRVRFDKSEVNYKLSSLLEGLVVYQGLPEQRAIFMQQLIMDRLSRLENK